MSPRAGRGTILETAATLPWACSVLALRTLVEALAPADVRAGLPSKCDNVVVEPGDILVTDAGGCVWKAGSTGPRRSAAGTFLRARQPRSRQMAGLLRRPRGRTARSTGRHRASGRGSGRSGRGANFDYGRRSSTCARAVRAETGLEPPTTCKAARLAVGAKPGEDALARVRRVTASS